MDENVPKGTKRAAAAAEKVFSGKMFSKNYSAFANKYVGTIIGIWEWEGTLKPPNSQIPIMMPTFLFAKRYNFVPCVFPRGNDQLGAHFGAETVKSSENVTPNRFFREKGRPGSPQIETGGQVSSGAQQLNFLEKLNLAVRFKRISPLLPQNAHRVDRFP